MDVLELSITNTNTLAKTAQSKAPRYTNKSKNEKKKTPRLGKPEDHASKC